MRQLTTLFLITILFCLLGCNPGTTQNPVVKTTSGKISGSMEDSLFAFKGIPYAKAERFMPPQDPDSWKGILECNEFSMVARQIVPWIPDSMQD
ncbi:MAG: carboxylesterase family protein, partial [Clostridiaceae bacterium]|nr:carboxylesterase family protein [Clostridiaceae bacterium]